ncbi:MAG: bifunctional 23S rRNA (guanine(2069)-N(7))-methyltransferase RlmK/23S rRNA (guanine(2445)-N(2))-methyltransferase RlmL [Desulfatiglandaceae bacterium]
MTENTASLNQKAAIFTATCAGGLEAILSSEIAGFGAGILKTSPGAVYFQGNLEPAYRACLWSRFANRVLNPVAEVNAQDENELYRQALEIDWPKYFDPDKTFSVICNATRASISNTHFAALRLKDAVADRFTAAFGRRPNVDTQDPDITLHLYLEGSRGSISMDMAGGSLHKRGYRLHGDQAPLKETLAAAIVHLSGWPYRDPAAPPLIDPMCGSGTLLIEAALMYGGMAPGLLRKRFGFHGWRGHDETIWRRLHNEAIEKAEKAKNLRWPSIVGYDASRSAVAAALENINRAGLKGLVHVERRELARLTRPSTRNLGKPGFVVSNPPYGHRLESWDSVPFLYACLGRKIREQLPGWRTALLTAEDAQANSFGLTPERYHELFNGPIKCRLIIFGPAQKPAPARQPTVSSSPDGAFSGRIKKNLRRLAGWAKRESITCYRIYDADIPEFNVAVDIYDGKLLVQEYTPPKQIDPNKATERFRSVIRDLAEIFNVEEKSIIVKIRSRQRGASQYQKIGKGGEFLEVGEGDCRFLVNLKDYLDTGLFLESRGTRKLLGTWAEGTRFLNLFGYTGTATVHAALGGAAQTTLVDLSPVYLHWAGCNLSLNGLSEENHRLVQADCLDWLRTCRYKFDLIYIHPPTFSNSKRTGTKFDLRTQHATLIHLAMRRLAPGGRTVFATSAARFQLDTSSLGGFLIKDISRITLPPDFIRSAGRHRCWEIRSAG